MTKLDALYECCQDPANRTPPEQEAEDLTVQRCKVCGRRHFELTVDPGQLGVEGASL